MERVERLYCVCGKLIERHDAFNTDHHPLSVEDWKNLSDKQRHRLKQLMYPYWYGAGIKEADPPIVTVIQHFEEEADCPDRRAAIEHTIRKRGA